MGRALVRQCMSSTRFGRCRRHQRMRLGPRLPVLGLVDYGIHDAVELRDAQDPVEPPLRISPKVVRICRGR